MFKRFISTVAALSIVFGAISPALASEGFTGDNGTFYYRYKTTPPIVDDSNEQQKDVVAYYVGGVGFDFSELLPLKNEWSDDNWSVTSGTLPDGITFNSATRTFEGKPTSPTSGAVAYLTGIDVNGNQVADAKVTFDIYEIQGTPRTVDLYAHTGKYHVDELSIPSGLAVDSWRALYKAPPGVTVNGPYFEGTPTAAGSYPVFIQGLNYMGEAIVTFFGKYTVEDGPTFPFIADFVSPLPQLEWGYQLGPYSFGAPKTHKINRAIDPTKAVRYFMEIDPTKSDGLPGSVSSNDNAKNLVLDGYIWQPYDTATIRYRALDSDGTEGYSNWFTFGSSDPQPGCAPYSQLYPLLVYTGTPAKISVPRPFGSQGRLEYFVASGKFPAGLSLDKDTGVISGTPLVAGDNQAMDFRVDVINGSNTVSTTCGYQINVQPGTVSITDATDGQAKHVRTGDVYTGAATIAGGIAPYSVSFTDPAALPLYFTTATQNTASIGISGVIPTAGKKSIGLTLKNGDGSSMPGSLTVTAHDELKVNTVPTVHIKRLDASQVWGSIPYDTATVIPDVKKGNQPQFTLSNVGGLPSDIRFSEDGDFTGLTKADAKSYGTFTATMSDYSGDKVTTDPFEIVVDPREPIAVDTLNAPSFMVENPQSVSAIPMTVKQPPGAKDLGVKWTLNNVGGITIPTWFHFDGDLGKITVDADIPYAERGSYGPFTLTATDDEGSTVTSQQFNVSIIDWKPPFGTVATVYRGSVSGDTSAQETATYVSIPSLVKWINEDTVIGGRKGVTFLSSEPTNPAGLDFYPADGSFAGVPTSEFNGNVIVRFKDARDREGELAVPLEVRAYPSVRMTQSEYEVPRLSDAAKSNPLVTGQQVNGFWNNPKWTLDTSAGHPALPSGMSVDASSGKIVGRTKDAVGTTVTGLRLKATSLGANKEELESYTQVFDLKITDPVPMTLDYGPATAKFFLTEDNGAYKYVSQITTTPNPGGSYVDPLAYSMDKSQAVADGMTGTLDVNSKTGNLSGFPDVLGRWNVLMNATDTEQTQPASPFTLDVWATLSGNIGRTNADKSFKLRVGEPFKTDALDINNKVGSVVFSTIPANLPSTVAVGFDATTGAFSDDSAFDSANQYTIRIQATDRDGRTFASPLPELTFNVIPALEASVPAKQTSIDTRQYSASADDVIDASFGVTIKNGLGTIRYSVVSDDLPGTLVNKLYALDGTFTGYQWTDEDRVGHSLPATTKAEDLPDLLPLDALVFDTMTPSLKGIPSKEGTFTFQIEAFDHYADDYIKSVPSQKENNSAKTAPITIQVKPALPLTVANTVASETIYQITTLPTLRTVATNNAYGRPVEWTPVGTIVLPQNVSFVKGATVLSYNGYPEQTGTFGSLIWKAKDRAGRSATSDAAELKVGPRKPLELIPSDDPAVRLVNVADANLTVTPRYSAYGKAIPDGDWSVSGTDRLPPGVNYAIGNNKVTFTGIPTVTGKYEGFTISAVDSMGSSRTISITFVVIEPTDEIRLEVSNVKTKRNVPFQMQSTATNTYGKVQFYSYDIDGDPRTHVSGQYAADLDINIDTGLVSGAFATAGDRNFDVWVTDTTKRVTSKPVTVTVIPDLRITVPTLVQSQQAVKLERTIDTTYALGTVSYEKGAGDWPEGVEVDPATGTIRSKYIDPITKEVLDKMQAASGTYSGLTVVAVDTFVVNGITYKDRQSSNQFSIFVDVADVLPVITTPAKTILGTQGTAIVSWRPVVKDDIEKKTWNYGGTKYKLSTDLTQYGLAFDENTGVISGTAHTPFIVRDMVITVTSQRGDSAKTNPFWVGMVPKLPLAASPTQRTSYAIRYDELWDSDPLTMINYVGNLTFSKGNQTVATNWSFDTDDGQFHQKSASTASVLTNQPAAGWPIYIDVTDEFNRTARFWYNQLFLSPLTVTTVASGSVPRNVDVTNYYAPTVVGGYGKVMFTATGLPTGMTIDGATGAISGKVPETVAFGTVFNITVTATDDYAASPRSKSATYPVTIYDPTKGHRYWKLTWAYDGGSYPARLEDLQFLGADSTNYSLWYSQGKATVMSAGIYAGWGSYPGMFDGNPATAGGHLLGKYIGLDFGANAPPIKAIKWWWYPGNESNAGDISAHFSDDGVNWTRVYDGTGKGREVTKSISGDW
ncbi:Ig domain-containing protein [Rhizobium sp. BK176]|uniref:Ig domain-containing protein n=1 Tax=Rhizobium sp. BK176 TaxID=2587071 RepID=UPI0021696E6D|nr:Ig domain-containing protein [Rhizobium sp. BK176]MCS4089108.1 hypothetical protein [Rhizobium sp. BK176]